MISGTGSLRSVDSSCTSSNSGISNNQNARSSTSSTATSNIINMAAQQDSTNTLVDDECFTTLNNDASALSSSPVAIPNAKPKERQRYESTSSTSSLDGWQIVTVTGSLTDRLSPRYSTPFSLDSSIEEGTTTTVKSDRYFAGLVPKDTPATRKDRLNGVRSLFYHCYCSTVGFKFKNGAETTFGALLGNFAEKVGFAQRTT